MKTKIREITVAQAIAEFESTLRAYESQYMMTYPQMQERILSGEQDDTMDMAIWAFNYRAWKRLTEIHTEATDGVNVGYYE